MPRKKQEAQTGLEQNNMNNVPQQAESAPQMANTQPQTEIGKRAFQEVKMLRATAKKKQAQMTATPIIGSNEVMKATEILRKYKEGKAHLEAKIVANEEFWKLRQWNYMQDGKKTWKPATSWLWSCIQSRYSDAMDSYPTCNFQPRQADDKAEAKKLSAIVPVILEHNRYEDVYSDIVWYALKHGGCVQGIFWDGNKHNGLGDVSIKKIDFINLFWESGITNIQESENVFTTELVSNRLLEQRYPQTQGKLNGKTITLAKYIYDDNVDTSDKSVVVDWYYHTEYNGKRTLQYCKFVNDIVLYATENETQRPEQMQIDPDTGIPVTYETGESLAERGLYDHGLYPFVVMSLYPIEGSICGYGLTDIGRDTQIQIDKLNKAITDNAVIGATPRYFIKNDGSVNEQEYSDITKPFVHVGGMIGDENIRIVETKSLDGNYLDFLNQKIEEMKFITSNQDVTNGGVPSGITAGSAISALQETAGKNARSSNKTFYRAYREMCYQVVELIRQFYDVPRTFRIAPDTMGGDEQFVMFDNSGIKPQQQATMGMNMGLRLPEFDIDVTAEKANPYKKMEINELALNFYNSGFFNPQMTDQALQCLNMMDFNKKDEVMQKIQEQGTMYEALLQFEKLAINLAQQISPEMADQVSQLVLQQGGQPVVGTGADVNLEQVGNEHPFNEKARAEARASTEAE